MKDISIRRQNGRVKLYIIYMMLMSITICSCSAPLLVNATSPISKRIGDYLHGISDNNVLYGYVGKDKDIVIPAINDDLIEIRSLGTNKYVRNVTLNDKVWRVSGGAFFRCKNLENIFVDPDNEYFSSIDGVLFDKEGTTLISYPSSRKQKEYHIPEGTLNVSLITTPININYLNYKAHLKRIYLPASIREFNTEAFYLFERLIEIYVDSGNEKYMSIDGMLIERKTGELVLYPEAKSKCFISPDEVKSIGEKVFYQKGIRYAEFNDDLSTIGANAFFGCKLRKVDIPDNVSIIEADAFDNNKIRTLNLGDSVRIIDVSAFSRNRIRTLNLGSSVEVIGTIAFQDNKITRLKLNDSLEWIGGGAFSGNNIRGELIFPGSLEYIGEDAFTSEKVSKVVISDGVFIEGSLFGSDKFKKAYDEYGAGTYMRTDEGEWIKQ